MVNVWLEEKRKRKVARDAKEEWSAQWGAAAKTKGKGKGKAAKGGKGDCRDWVNKGHCPNPDCAFKHPENNKGTRKGKGRGKGKGKGKGK